MEPDDGLGVHAVTWGILGFAAMALAAVVGMALDARAARKEAMHVRDRLDETGKLADQYKSERDVEVAAHAVTSAQLKEARDRLAVAESQRNDAFREARDHFVERIKESNAETAADLVSDLLGHVWPSVHGVPPLPAKDDNSGAGNNLIDPAKL